MGEHTLAARAARAARYEGVAAHCHELAGRLLRAAHGEDVPFSKAEHVTAKFLRIKHGWAARVGLGDSTKRGARGDYQADALARAHGYDDHRTARSALFARARHYERAARGQRERVERVLSCKTEAYELVGTPLCPSCESEAREEKLTRCDGWRYCMPCRSERCREYRKRIDSAIEHQRKLHRSKMHPGMPRRWSEKLVTFTVPHSGSAAHDLAALQRSWAKGKFLARLKSWFKPHSCRRCRGGTQHNWIRPSADTRVQRDGLPFVRVLELTGSDGGHAHAHVWVLSPYLPHWVLRVLWGFSMRDVRVVADHDNGQRDAGVPVRLVADILADPDVIAQDDSWAAKRARAEIRALATWKAGTPAERPLAYLPWPVLDVREAYGKVGNEIAKYMTKDAERDPVTRELQMVDPFKYAQLVEATEERRMVCVSRYLWVEIPPKLCLCCGRGKLRSRIVPGRAIAARPSGPRGPPLPFIQEAQVSAMSPAPLRLADPLDRLAQLCEAVGLRPL